jgi:hypothetical protein
MEIPAEFTQYEWLSIEAVIYVGIFVSSGSFRHL